MSQPYIVPPCDRPVEILYRDEHLLLVDKPDLLLSIPGRNPLNSDCVISRMRETFASASVVHRLDLDTSGIMVIPLDKPTHSHISRQFQEHRVDKSYQTMVYGIVEQDSGEIDLPIAPDWDNRPRQVISEERGKQALTRFEVLARFPSENCTRLRLQPVTGRSHQLRIHLAEIDHPILGCDLYAHEEALSMAKRLMLHAHTLAFEHPATGQQLTGEAPLPF